MEELTRYTLQQQKTIEKLETRAALDEKDAQIAARATLQGTTAEIAVLKAQNVVLRERLENLERVVSKEGLASR